MFIPAENSQLLTTIKARIRSYKRLVFLFGETGRWEKKKNRKREMGNGGERAGMHMERLGKFSDWERPGRYGKLARWERQAYAGDWGYWATGK